MRRGGARRPESARSSVSTGSCEKKEPGSPQRRPAPIGTQGIPPRRVIRRGGDRTPVRVTRRRCGVSVRRYIPNRSNPLWLMRESCWTRSSPEVPSNLLRSAKPPLTSRSSTRAGVRGSTGDVFGVWGTRLFLVDTV